MIPNQVANLSYAIYILIYGLKHAIRATSHTRLKARDHCTERTLIGRKAETVQFTSHWKYARICVWPTSKR